MFKKRRKKKGNQANQPQTVSEFPLKIGILIVLFYFCFFVVAVLRYERVEGQVEGQVD